MNCRGLFASALITTQQQRIKLPHICIPKAYTYLHLFSSHLGYVVRKCYDFKTPHAVLRCSETIQFGKTAFDLYAKLKLTNSPPIWWDLRNEIGMHENLRVLTAESCQWRHVIALSFFRQPPDELEHPQIYISLQIHCLVIPMLIEA